jgi:hypothetical protein
MSVEWGGWDGALDALGGCRSVSSVGVPKPGEPVIKLLYNMYNCGKHIPSFVEDDSIGLSALRDLCLSLACIYNMQLTTCCRGLSPPCSGDILLVLTGDMQFHLRC